MALLPSMLSRFNFTYDNFGANPGATPGTSVVPGVTNAEGSWTQVASSANIAQNIYAFYLRISDGATAATIKDHLLDVGVDPAGGTSYTAVISNIVCGSSGPITAAGGFEFIFPLFIKSGSSVAVRIQGVAGTAGTVRVGVKFYGLPSRPEVVPVGYFSETIGTITNSQGVSFTPGNAADGTWASLGTTAQAMWWWQLAYQVSNTTITAEYTYIELAYGDGSNKHIICELMHQGTTSEQIGCVLNPSIILWEAFCPVPAGATLYVRGRCLNAPDTGYNAVAIGIGG